MSGLLTKTIALVGVASGMLGTPLFACEDLRSGMSGIVTQVSDGDSVWLDSGVQVRLIGIQAPKLPLGRDGFETWPLADAAKAMLETLALGQPVQIRYGDAERDRHGRVLGHMFVGEDEVWAQGEMVAAGMARVYSFPDNRFCLEELFQAEAVARVNRAGIWSDNFYQIRHADRPEQIAEFEGRYELVEGRVLTANRYGSRVYLNFGLNWDEDFTVIIDRVALRLFEQAEIDPLTLQDGVVRVRGWVDVYDGPRIEVTHPEQIEIVALH